MWIVVGVLLGLVVLASLVGFHTGPHGHVTAGVFGLVVAALLAFMVIDGRSTPIVWALLSAELAVSAGLGIMAWTGFSRRGRASYHLRSLEAAEGVALGDLTPNGIVRVGGEQWSAVCLNGTVKAGTRVQVLRAGGVRLDVWGENAEAEEAPLDWKMGLDKGGSKEQNT